MSDTDKEDYCRRFVAYMTENAGFSNFSSGQSIRDYAESIAPKYWENRDALNPEPEADADADMDCWEAEDD